MKKEVYLSESVCMLLSMPGVIILVHKAKVFLSLPFQCGLSPVGTGWEVALQRYLVYENHTKLFAL